MSQNLDGNPTISEEMLLADFAKAALTGILSPLVGDNIRSVTAEDVYVIAKAMLAQHKKEIQAMKGGQL